MRRYRLEPYTEYEWGDFSYPSVRPVEDEFGQWVPYENAKNAVKQLTKQLERLKKENERLRNIQF